VAAKKWQLQKQQQSTKSGSKRSCGNGYGGGNGAATSTVKTNKEKAGYSFFASFLVL
jgi:hypothetical protein